MAASLTELTTMLDRLMYSTNEFVEAINGTALQQLQHDYPTATTNVLEAEVLESPMGEGVYSTLYYEYRHTLQTQVVLKFVLDSRLPIGRDLT